MKWFSMLLPAFVCGLALLCAGHVRGEEDRETPAVRFAPMAVYIDSGAMPLAAYQLDLQAPPGVTIVGIEGGEHEAFRDPPYYDPAAMQRERVIIAAFSTLADEALPVGSTCVATIHVMIEGEVEPDFAVHLDAAGTSDGSAIDVTVHTSLGQDS